MTKTILLPALASLIALIACDKPSTTTEPTTDAATVSPSATVVVLPSVPPASSSVAVAEAPATTPVPTSPPHAPPVRPLSPSPSPAPAPPPTVDALKPASKHLAGNHFVLDVASPGCRVGTDCAMTITLQAAGEYHVNKEYPYKLTAVAAPTVTFLGKADANTFSRATGDFVEVGAQTATMTVRFRPTAAGDANVSGMYKFSVCSADQCQLEQQTLGLVISVL